MDINTVIFEGCKLTLCHSSFMEVGCLFFTPLKPEIRTCKSIGNLIVDDKNHPFNPKECKRILFVDDVEVK